MIKKHLYLNLKIKHIYIYLHVNVVFGVLDQVTVGVQN
jgi:hypothetical protein